LARAGADTTTNGRSARPPRSG